MKVKSESEVTQLCLTLCDPIDCSLPGSSIHGIFQARILEWVAISFSRAIRWGRDEKENLSSLVAQMVKCLPIMRETRVQSLGQEDLLKKEMAAHSRSLAWKSHGRRSLADYSPWGCKSPT